MHGPTAERRRRWFRRLAAAAVLCAAGAGCTRKFFREKSDKDVVGVITQKNVVPEWQLENWHVYPDPRARFADPTNPDRPPYPPDDIAAWYLSPNPQAPRKKPGIGRVEGDGYYNLLSGFDLENRALDQLRERDEKADDAKKDAPAAPPKPEPIPAPQPAPPLPKLPDAKPTSARPVPREIAFRPVPPRPAPAPLPPLPEPVGLASAVVAGAAPVAPTEPPRSATRVMDARPPAPFAAPRSVAMVSLAKPRPSVPEPTVGLAKPRPALQEPPAPSLPVAAAGGVRPTAPHPHPARTPAIVQASFAQPPMVAAPADTPIPTPAPAEPGKLPGYGASAAGTDANYLQALASRETSYRVRLDQVIDLGLVNAREFQDRREDVYLAALPVTLERFSFAAQPFFMTEAIREITGAERPEGRGDRWRVNTTTGFSRTFSTGAQLLFQIANQFVIDITGDKPYTSVSNLSLNITQPLLQGGGKAVTLEPLTQAERTLLYAIRSYARFRRIFYVALAAGGGYTNNPYGLQGLSANLGRGIGNNLTSPSIGYLPLLLRSAVIANQQKNITFLEDLLKLYQAFREGGQQSDLQVGQVEQNLLNARQDLLGNTTSNLGGGTGTSAGIRGYQDSLDQFKLQLGLPMTLSLELDDSPLRPVRRQLSRFEAVYAQVRAVEEEARRTDPDLAPAAFRARWRALLTESVLVRGTDFASSLRARWAEWESLTEDGLGKKVAGLLDERRTRLDARADRQVKGEPEPEAEARAIDRLNAEIDLARFEQTLRRFAAAPWGKEKGPLRSAVQAAVFRDVFNAFYQLILEGRNERLGEIRGQWPKLPGLLVEGCDLLEVPLDDATTVGIRTALTHRLDLMNNRAQLVDSYRQIAVRANALQGVLNVSYDLQSASQPDTADLLSFSGGRSRHQLAVNAELPLVRRAERNAYRAAQISYQRQRRLVQAFEDNIANDVRGDVRELRAIAEQYRIQQRLIELGYSQVDNAQAILLSPPVPGAQADAGSAAALTNQVLQAQSALLNAQNDLYTIWVSFLISRMQLYLDLEQMPLDTRGLWTDEFPSPDRDDRPVPAGNAERVAPPPADRARGAAPGGGARAAR